MATTSARQSVPHAAPPGAPPANPPATRDQELLAILAEQAATYDQLQHVAQQRRMAIAAADVDTLGEIVGREQPLLVKLRRLEDLRLRVVRPWADALHVTSEQLTISDICRLIDPAVAQELTAAKERLLVRAKALEEINRSNRSLLEACVDSVNRSLEHLFQIVQFTPRYTRGGYRGVQEMNAQLTDIKA